jgi:hypothetical protein
VDLVAAVLVFCRLELYALESAERTASRHHGAFRFNDTGASNRHAVARINVGTLCQGGSGNRSESKKAKGELIHGYSPVSMMKGRMIRFSGKIW